MSFTIETIQKQLLEKEVSSLIDKYCPINPRYLNKEPMIDDILQALITFLEEHYDELQTNEEKDADEIAQIAKEDDIDFLISEYSDELRIFETIYGLKDKVLEDLEENCEFRRIKGFDLKLHSKICNIIHKVTNMNIEKD